VLEEWYPTGPTDAAVSDRTRSSRQQVRQQITEPSIRGGLHQRAETGTYDLR
jgi:hypothetical protein